MRALGAPEAEWTDVAGRSAQDIGALLQKGVAAHRAGQITQAKNAYLKVIDAMPREPNANRLLGAVFLQEGQFKRARKHIEVAVASAPDDSEGYYFLARVSLGEKKTTDAARAIERCLALNPRHENARIVLANMMIAEGQFDAALVQLDTIIAANPQSLDAHVSRIDALFRADRVQQAWDALEPVLARFPQSLELRTRRGDLHRRDRNPEGAARDYKAVLAVIPSDLAVRRKLAGTRPELCNWPEDGNLLKEFAIAESSDELSEDDLSLHTIAWKVTGRQALEATRRAWARMPVEPPMAPARITRRGDRIRLGYVSSDLCGHAVGTVIEDVFRHHDRSSFDIVNFSILPDNPNDKIRQSIQSNCTEVHFVDTMRDRAFAEFAALQNIDVLVDVNGFTKHSYLRTFRFRPAPVQIGYLGYPGTTGAPFMDYIVADPMLAARENEGEFAEKILRLPDTYMPFSAAQAIPGKPMTRQEAGLPETGFVFACLNNAYKLTDDAFSSWVRILDQVEGSVIWFRSTEEVVRANLRAEAVKRGLDPERLIFAGRTPERADHLSRYAHAGLFLDTFYYGAHSTALESLAMGVPVVTKVGPTFAGRVGAGLVRAAGLPELVTHTVAEYEALAVALAHDPERLAGLKRHLVEGRQKQSLPLFDTARYTRHLEAGFRIAYERALRGEAPVSFDVPVLA